MGRVIRRPGLLAELRDIRRRLGRLEAASPNAPSPATVSGDSGAGSPGTGGAFAPLLPARPRDWFACDSPEWEALLHARWDVPVTAGTVELVVAAVASADTGGEFRLTADGVPLGPPVPVGPEQVRTSRSVPVAGVRDLRIEARRSDGDGEVRLTAAMG